MTWVGPRTPAEWIMRLAAMAIMWRAIWWFGDWSWALSLFEQFRGGTTSVIGLIASGLIWVGHPKARQVFPIWVVCFSTYLVYPLLLPDDMLASAVSSVLLVILLVILSRLVFRVLPASQGAKDPAG